MRTPNLKNPSSNDCSKEKPMIEQTDLAGSFTLPGTSMPVDRMGYGAMQLAGPGVWGPPRDVNAAIAVLRAAVESGVNHIDTNDYWVPVAVLTSPGFMLSPDRSLSTAFLTI
jgi:hypothetical protein